MVRHPNKKVKIANIAALAKAGAAIGGVVAWLHGMPDAGSTTAVVVTAAAAAQRMGEICSALAEMAKAISADRQKQEDPEVWLGQLMRLAALESYAFAAADVLKDYGESFRLNVRESIGNEKVPTCTMDDNRPEIIAAGIFDHLDELLRQLFAGDDESVSPRQRSIVESVRVSAERKLRALLSRPCYSPLQAYLTSSAVLQITLSQRDQGSQRAIGGTPTSDMPRPSQTAANLGSSVPSPDLSDRVHKMFQTRFDNARWEIDNGSCEKGAVDFGLIIADIRQLEDSKLGRLLARSIYNRGVALFNLYRDSEAIKCFAEAASIQAGPETVPLAPVFVQMCARNFAAARAILRDITISESVRNAWLAECFLRENKPEEALSATTSLDSSGGYALRAQSLSAMERFPDAATVASEGLRRWPDDVSLQVAHAYAVSRPLIDEMSNARAVHRRPSSEMRHRIEEAGTLVGRVCERCRSHAYRRHLFDALNWRGALLIHLGMDAEAITVFNEANEIRPGDITTLSNKSYAEIRAGKFEDALKTARSIKALDFDEGFNRELAILLCSGASDDARRIMNAAIASDPDLPLKDRRFACSWITTLQATNDTEALRTWVDQLKKIPGQDRQVLCACGDALAVVDGPAAAEALLDQAAVGADGFDRDVVQMSRGRVRFNAGNWAGALECLLPHGIDPFDTHFVDDILWCFYHLDRASEAIELGNRLAAAGLLTLRAKRALAAAYLKLHNTSEAERIASQIADNAGATEADYINLFELRRRLRPWQEALAVLERGAVVLPNAVMVRSALAMFYGIAGDWRKSLEAAREVSRLAPGSDEERKVWSRYAVAKMPATLLTAEERQRIGSAFVSQPGVEQVSAIDGAGHPLRADVLASLQDRARNVLEVMSWYESHKAPGSFAAPALGINVLRFWWTITNEHLRRWWVSEGDSAERDRETEAASAASSVVMDYSSLMSATGLGLLGHLPILFRRVYVTAETRKLFVDELQLRKATLAPYATAIVVDGRVVLREHDPLEREREDRQLLEIMTFLESPAVEIAAPTTDVLSLHKDLLRALEDDSTQKCAILNALVAKSMAAALLCDELMVRSFAVGDVGIQSFSTMAMFWVAHTKQPDLQIDTFELTKRYLELNYHFVCLPSNFLTTYLARTGYQRTTVADRLLTEIASTTYPGIPGAHDLGRAVAVLWFNPQGGWATSDWMPRIIEELNQLGESPDVVWFAAGVCFELRWFPSVVLAIFRYLNDDAKLSPAAKMLLNRGLSLMIAALSDRRTFGANVNAAWIRASGWIEQT